MKNELLPFANIPVTAAQLTSLYPQLSGGNSKLRRLDAHGDIASKDASGTISNGMYDTACH